MYTVLFHLLFPQEFRAALAKHISGSPESAGLIRKHDKNLSEGDFSCPSHSKAELWRRRSSKEIDFERLKRLCCDCDDNVVRDANEAMGGLLKLSSARLNKKGEVMLLRLDRPSALTAVICGILEKGVFWHPFENAKLAGRFESCEMSSRMGKTTELSALRCSMVAGGLSRLSRDLNQQNDDLNQALTRVSCTDKNNKDTTGYLQVGVVKSGMQTDSWPHS